MTEQGTHTQAEGPVAREIRARLRPLNPTTLIIQNESDRHIGHAGHNETGETHFTVMITAEALRGLSRVAAQRRVYDLLGTLLQTHIHAISLRIGIFN